jgi:hypothetical protein
MWYPQKAAFRVGSVSGLNWNNDSIGNYSFASGGNTKAKAVYSTSMGNSTIASGDVSTSMGYQTTAAGDYSTSMGFQTTAAADYSTSMGIFTTASGLRATSMGGVTIASGAASTSMGFETTASGIVSTSMGYQTTAVGDYSTSMGEGTEANGYASTTMGIGTITNNSAHTAIGKYNDPVVSGFFLPLSDPVFTVGNGTSASDRKNAMTILKTGKTGININDPAAKLHVVADGLSGATSGQYSTNASLIVEDNSTCYIQLMSPSSSTSGILSGTDQANNRSSIFFNPDSSVSIRAGGSNTRIFVDNNGNIGMGTNNPTQKLHVIGNILASGTITPSDIRYKKDIERIDHPLEKIDEIRGVTYKMKTDEFPENGFTDETQAGVIAQEVEAVLPQVVITDNSGYKAVDYSKIVPLLIEGIKELKKQNEILQKRIEKLERK